MLPAYQTVDRLLLNQTTLHGSNCSLQSTQEDGCNSIKRELKKRVEIGCSDITGHFKVSRPLKYS